MTERFDRDEDPRDPDRSRMEIRILVAVVLVPILLGIVVNGLLYSAVANATAWVLAHASWPFLFVRQMLFTWTLLLIWRCPLFQRPLWRPLLVVLLTIMIRPILDTAIYFSDGDFAWMSWDRIVASYWNIDWLVIVAGSGITFFLIRRITGICFSKAPQPPTRQPITIAELIAWVSLCAVWFALLPRIGRLAVSNASMLSDYEYRTLLLAYAAYYATEIVVLTLSVLCVLAVSGHRIVIAFPAAVGATYLLSLIPLLVNSVLYSTPFEHSFLEFLSSSILVSTATLLAIAVIRRRGYRIIRRTRSAAVRP